MRPDIRDAVLEDLPEIIEMVRVSTASALPSLSFDPEVTHDVVEAGILDQNTLVAVAEDDEGLCGYVIGVINLCWFGNDRVASDWMVYAENRAKGWLGYRLLSRFVDWAKENDARLINTLNLSGIPDDGFCRGLERLGYKRAGSLIQNVIEGD
ncbi:GNAT family N-acetyltransferase [Spiribacter onubensis]|uniref:N-acetyltransferase domain-containing protein n=1 Tax=Spiribacter onubensis TaxID=3122420 RepID=A0ABV3S6X4_9GAMM